MIYNSFDLDSYSHPGSRLDIHVLKVKLEEDMVPSPRVVAVVVEVPKYIFFLCFLLEAGKFYAIHGFKFIFTNDKYI